VKSISFYISPFIMAALLSSCAQTELRPYETPPENANPDAVFYDRWAEFQRRVLVADLQEDCIPRLIEPADSVDYRGTVVLIHGHSGCPQQYFELADLLALQGFRSVLVLMPGQGRQYDGPAKDNVRDLPTGTNWRSAFDAMALEVNGLMEYARGERVIGGLSLGASVSLYISLKDRDLYDRQLVIAPFFAVGSTPMTGGVAAVTANTPLVRQGSVKPFGVKQPCLEKRQQGRAGICNYKLKHVGALTALGKYLFETLQAEPLEMLLQYVGTENDTVVNNEKVRIVLNVQQQTGRTSACFYPDGVPHAMVSEFDSPGIDMYWLDSLLSGAVGFISGGEPFPVGQESLPEAPYPLCAIETERWD
jgi:alpha-beta hydrolase superfamily lysophospholipase